MKLGGLGSQGPYLDDFLIYCDRPPSRDSTYSSPGRMWVSGVREFVGLSPQETWSCDIWYSMWGSLARLD